jgi:hypothetical protein
MTSTIAANSTWEPQRQLLVFYLRVFLKMGAAGAFWNRPTHKICVVGCSAIVASRYKTSENVSKTY